MSDAGADPNELADRVAALEDRLEDLQAELSDARRDRGVQIPTPRDLLRATDAHAIPALIGILEAHIHALRLLQRTIRVLAPPPSDTGQERPATPAFRRATRSLTEQLDRLLADLEQAPTSAEGTRLDRLREEADAIRAELAKLSRVPDDPNLGPTDTADEAGEDAGEDEAPPEDEHDPGIDVDAELRSIRSELTDEDDEPGDQAGAQDGNGDPDRD